MPEQFDVVVIGGGPAGLVTASGCARLGRRVALIEKQALGGDCLWTGCVPTKSLVATAKLAHQMRNASAYGLPSTSPVIDPRAVMESMRETRRLISRHDDPEKFRQLGIDVIEGSARLISRGIVTVGGRELTAKDIVIATGSRTAVPPAEGLEAAGTIDHVSFLERNELPGSVLIMGGGYIGIEFAQMFRRLGSEVVVVEMAEEIISKEDHEVIGAIRAILAAEGISVRTSWSVESVRPENGRRTAVIRSSSGSRDEITVDEIFVASGRRGNTEGLGLETAGVKLNRSYVEVDAFLETSAARIWACGDVHGGLQFTHVAAYEAVKLVRNMLFPGRSKVSYVDIPWTLYTDPEVGHIGMTETEARAAHGDDEIRIYRVDMADVDRAVVDRTTQGFLKIVSDTRGRILGAHAVCSNASTLIEEIVLARKKGVRIAELAQLISSYPSLADAVQKAASGYYQNLSSGWLAGVARRIAAWSQ